jgi:proteasome lid subunit RPN8/RPN11
MLDHARAELPNEACGLLSGTVGTGLATEFHPARNSERSALRYTVHPDDLLRIILEIEDAGRDLVGIFHSHTHTPAVPSATDLRDAMYPDPFYVLATLADPDATPERALRAWQIRGGRSLEVPLLIE